MDDLLVLFALVLHLGALVYCLSKIFEILSKKLIKERRKNVMKVHKINGINNHRRNPSIRNRRNRQHMNLDDLLHAEERWDP